MNTSPFVSKVREKEELRFFELTILYWLPEKVPVSYGKAVVYHLPLIG